jgi:hypothetical protein
VKVGSSFLFEFSEPRFWTLAVAVYVLRNRTALAFLQRWTERRLRRRVAMLWSRVVTERSRLVRLGELADVALNTVGQKGFTTLIATGIVNPVGPTLNVVAADDYFPTAQGRIPILHFMLNPFSHTCRVVGTLDIGDEWEPVDDLEPFCSLEFGSCPTLLLPSIFNSPDGNELVYARLLRECDDGVGVLSRVEQYPGDPWSRVQSDIDATLRPDYVYRNFGALDQDGALRLAQIQLQPANIRAEFQAFLGAWDGAITLVKDSALAKRVMTMEAFLELFARFAKTCDLPLEKRP